MSISDHEATMNLYDFIHDYCNKMAPISFVKKLILADQEFIKYTFEYAKLLNRYFVKNNLVTKYAILTQNIQRNPTETQRRNIRIKITKPI